MNIKSRADLLTGLMFFVAGTAFAALSTEYRAGTAARMGPGYFPFWIGVLLALVGVIVTLTAFSRSSGDAEKIEPFSWRIAGLVLGSVVVFGALLRPLGLLLSLFAMVMIASAASREIGWKTALINALVLSAFCWLLFIKGLGLQIPVLPRWPLWS